MIALPADLVDRYVDAPYLRATAIAECYVRAHAARILASFGIDAVGRAAAAAVAAGLPIASGARPALDWLLAEVGAATAEAPAARAPGTPPSARAPLADDEPAARHLDAHRERIGSSIPLIDHVAEHYPAFLRGERSPLSILFRGAGVALWEAYFSSTNPLYDVHNALAAEGLRAAAAALPLRRVLELGAGTGGATAALRRALDQSGAEGAELVASDVSPAFVARARDRLTAPGISHRCLDFDRPLAPQGVAAAGVDAIVAVNALHASGDVAAALAECRRALRPGGLLIVSESICEPGDRLHQEFVFNLLPAAAPRAGGGSRFFSGRRWRELLAASAFAASVHVNGGPRPIAMLAVARTDGASPGGFRAAPRGGTQTRPRRPEQA
jgi:SAM-dependent methyltransferase